MNKDRLPRIPNYGQIQKWGHYRIELDDGRVYNTSDSIDRNPDYTRQWWDENRNLVQIGDIEWDRVVDHNHVHSIFHTKGEHKDCDPFAEHGDTFCPSRGHDTFTTLRCGNTWNVINDDEMIYPEVEVSELDEECSSLDDDDIPF